MNQTTASEVEFLTIKRKVRRDQLMGRVHFIEGSPVLPRTKKVSAIRKSSSPEKAASGILEWENVRLIKQIFGFDKIQSISRACQEYTPAVCTGRISYLLTGEKGYWRMAIVPVFRKMVKYVKIRRRKSKCV